MFFQFIFPIDPLYIDRKRSACYANIEFVYEKKKKYKKKVKYRIKYFLITVQNMED